MRRNVMMLGVVFGVLLLAIFMERRPPLNNTQALAAETTPTPEPRYEG
jgi:hypothetical protein